MHRTRILRPAEGVMAFYDGRIEGYRYAEGPNWVDDGALSLGIASYAIVDGDDAIIYDPHVSVEHGEFVRQAVEAEGARNITVVLSHSHLDHVAGTAAFEGCEILANERTAERLAANREAIEAGTSDGPPGIDPLTLPTRTFSGSERLEVGDLAVELIHVDIHSDDATVLWLPERGLLLAGDTMEDTITYVAEPEGFDRHLADLDRVWELAPERILPNHGDPDVIAEGGYTKAFIRATQQYIRALKRMPDDRALQEEALEELIAGPLAAGWVNYFEPYEAVHRQNVASVLAAAGRDDPAVGSLS